MYLQKSYFVPAIERTVTVKEDLQLIDSIQLMLYHRIERTGDVIKVCIG